MAQPQVSKGAAHRFLCLSISRGACLRKATRINRIRDWLGGKAFRVMCWLYGLDPKETTLETGMPF